MRIKKILPLAGALVIFTICIIRLSTGLGLSDNGDFHRVISTNGIHYLNDDKRYFNPEFDFVMDVDGDSVGRQLIGLFVPKNTELYYSPHFIIIGLSKGINYIYNFLSNSPLEIYRIRVMGYLYAVMLSLGVYGILKYFTRIKCVIAAILLIAFVFCDGAYLAYFNSFYGEPLQIVSILLITAGLLNIYKNKSAVWFLITIVAALLLDSKLANVPVSVLVILAAFLLMRKKLWVGGVCTAGIACTVIFTLLIPSWMSDETVYQSVFFGILKNTDYAQQYTKELGLPEEYAALADTNAYLPNYPVDITTEEFKNNFYDKIGRAGVCAFYIKHPIELMKKITKSVSYASSIKPPSLASGTKYRMDTDTKFSTWNNFRIKTKLLYNPFFIFFTMGIMTAAGICGFVNMVKKRRSEGAFVIFYLYLAALYINLFMPILANGEADLAKHMFFFIQLVDLGVCAGIVYIIAAKKYQIYAVAAAIFTVFCTAWLNLPAKYEAVSFAGYEWTVIDDDGVNATLVLNGTAAEKAFDKNGEYGNNLWETSDLRKWLNSKFLAEEDYAKIIPTEHYVTLSEEYADMSESGFHSLYWTHYGDDIDDDYERTYRKKSVDKVYLLTAQQYAKGNFKRDTDVKYWLCEPYGRRDSMVRYADKNGFVLHCDAKEALGVRPVIKVNKGDLTE